MQEPLQEQLKSPNYLLVDFAKLEAPPQTHLCFIALDQFVARTSVLPKPRLVVSAKYSSKHKVILCKQHRHKGIPSSLLTLWALPLNQIIIALLYHFTMLVSI